MMLSFPFPRFTEHGEQVRARLMALIRKKPGIHKSELGRLSGLSWGSLSHHLVVMRRDNLIRVKVLHNRLTIYGADIRDEDLRWVQVLRDPVTEQVLARIQRTPGLGPQAIADQMSGVSRKIIRRHLTRLEEVGYIRRSPDYHPRFFPVGPGEGFTPPQPEGPEMQGPRQGRQMGGL